MTRRSTRSAASSEWPTYWQDLPWLDELRAEQGANLNEADLPWFMVQLNGPRRMETIWDGLNGRGLADDELEKIMGANVHRVYSESIG